MTVPRGDVVRVAPTRQRLLPNRSAGAASAGSYTRSVLYGSAASYYARFRPPYPPELIALLADRFELDGTGRLLDVACGTGLLAFPLAPHVAEVVGVDADPGMLAQAALLAPENATLVERRAEEIDASLGMFRLATIGTAFHWLDRPRVLALLDPLTPGLAIAGASQPDEEESPWWDACQEVVRAFLGPRRRAGTRGYFEHSGELWADVLAASPFGRPEVHEFEVEREWEAEDVVGLFHSMSYSSPELLGGRIEAFGDALRARLAEFDLPLCERAVYEAILCVR